MTNTQGKIRVGKLQVQGSSRIAAKYENFEVILVHTAKSGKYSSLSPYVLKNEKGHIMENIWHAHKVWPRVGKVQIPKSQWDRRTIWSHAEEVHVDQKGAPNAAYFEWREKLLKNPDPVRYPAGYANRRNAQFSFLGDDFSPSRKLSYVEARKQIYFPVYVDLVRKEKAFDDLKKKLKSGKNLLIVEVDGPNQSSLDYYKQKYGVSDDFISQQSIEATPANLNIVLNDERHPFGHGYCLAAALLDLDIDDIDKVQTQNIKKSKIEG